LDSFLDSESEERRERARGEERVGAGLDRDEISFAAFDDKGLVVVLFSLLLN